MQKVNKARSCIGTVDRTVTSYTVDSRFKLRYWLGNFVGTIVQLIEETKIHKKSPRGHFKNHFDPK